MSRASFHPLHHCCEYGHAGLHTIGNLLVHTRLCSIGNFIRQLQTPHYGTGMHHDRIGFGEPHALGSDLEIPNVLFQTDLFTGKALLLNTKRHDDIGRLSALSRL